MKENIVKDESKTVKNKSGFLLIGAGGGNVGIKFYLTKYPCLFVNSAMLDLDSLSDVEERHKYHIPGGEGCNKDRKKSKELFRKDIDNIINEAKEKLSGVEYLFIIGSAGGGTASGVLASMKRIAMKELGLKACIIVTILPDIRTESVKALINAYETLAEIETLEEAGATFILDNSKNANKLRINEMFFCYLDALLTNDSSSVLGNVDNAEIEELLSTPGMAIISKLGKDKSDTKQLINTFHNNIYAPMENDKVIKYIGLINAGDGRNIQMADVYKEVGSPFDTYMGYESDSTICMLAGLSLPYTKMEEIKGIIDANKETIKRNLTAQNKGKLSEGLGFFDDFIQTDKPKTESIDDYRDLLF